MLSGEFSQEDRTVSEPFNTQEDLLDHIHNCHKGITPKSSLGWIFQTGTRTVPCPGCDGLFETYKRN
ncbi:hypothetical protein DM02DRAFT_355029 [Periconia macrospinosa]|uniref:Uncharacterized protein n=1 Tax=Periconia macrospinosa TaxID=97972 RepID=A0A2V1E979_9PLEO|nr:hypothetical protein DM02DRAFT_355029 [Periconia macrospinosa]